MSALCLPIIFPWYLLTMRMLNRIWKKLLAIYLVITIPFLLILVAIFISDVNLHSSETIDDKVEDVRLAGKIFGGFIEETFEDQQSLGIVITKIEHSPEEITDFIAPMKVAHFLNGSWFLNTEKRVVGGLPPKNGADLSKNKAMGAASGKRNVLTNLEENTMQITLASRITKGGKTAGFLLSEFKVYNFAKIFPLSQGSAQGIVVIDANGNLVFQNIQAKTPANRHWKNLPAVKKALDGKTTKTSSFKPPGFKELIGALKPVDGLGWVAGAFTEKSVALAPVRRSEIMNTLAALGLVIIALLISMFFATSIARPVKKLSYAAEELGGGNLDREITVNSGDEVQVLSRNLNDMRLKLKQTLGELKKQLHERKVKLDRTKFLQTIGSISASNLRANNLAQQAIDFVTSSFNIKPAFVMLYNPDAKGLEIIAERGLPLQIPRPSRVVRLDEPRNVIEVFRTGKPLVVEDIDKAHLRRQTESEIKLIPWVKSLVIVPLVSKERVIGALSFASEKRGFFNQDNLSLWQAAADDMATGLENSLLYENQEKISSTLQKSFLPGKIPPIKGLDIGVHYQSATAEAAVGGDFYDFVKLGGRRWAIIVGDVSGKGVEAAADTAMIKYILRGYLFRGFPLADSLSEVNDMIQKQLTRGRFVTLAVVVYLGHGVFELVNAGHPRPFLFQKSKGSFIKESGLAVGVFPGKTYKVTRLRLAAQDLLALYTDGLTEARVNSSLFGEEGLRRLITNEASLSTNDLAQRLSSTAKNFADGVLSDDLLVMIIKRI